MTYYYKKFSFTAFSGADLFGDGRADGGDRFVMPKAATTTIEVADDDYALSGDSYDHATDHYGQNAAIEGPSGHKGNGGQIYAESYHWVSDQYGKKYVLIEIEQEGTHEKFYTFYSPYGVPPADAHLTIGSECNISGDWLKYENLDAGEKTPPTGSVSGRLFIDGDRDNTEWNAETRAWEEGFEGAKVELIDAHGNVVATTTTDAYGSYTFDHVAVGDYSVRFDEPEGYDFVKKDVGSFTEDSDADRTTGRTDSFHVAEGSHVRNIDAGIDIETGKVTGTVFCDTDCDGIALESQTIAGKSYTIEAEDMYACGFDTVHSATASGGALVKLVTTSYTDWDGYLQTRFDGETGVYDLTLRVQDENDGQSTIWVMVGGHFVKAVCLDRDTDGAGNDNGGFSTYVIEDVSLRAGVDIQIVADGNRSEFVRIDKLHLDGKSKTVTVSEPVKDGVTVKLIDASGAVVATTMTDANGTYTFDDVRVGEYKVMGVAPDGTEFTIKDAGTNDHIDSDVNSDGLSDTVTVTKDGVVDIDLGVCEIETGAITGRFFLDRNGNAVDDGEPGIAGVQVALIAGGATLATTFTNAQGDYSFADIDAGTYSVQFTDPDGVLAGTGLVAPNQGGNDTIDSDAVGDVTLSEIAGIVVEAGETTADNDAGVAALPGAITGRVFLDENGNAIDDGDPGVDGVTVNLLTADGTFVTTTQTAADGSYTFDGIAGGDYIVEVIESTAGGAIFVAQDIGSDDTVDSDVSQATGRTSVSVVPGETTSDVDAGVELPKTAAIGDLVFLDTNGNGIRDVGEAGVSGVGVTLVGAGQDGVFGSADDTLATTTTGTSGNYRFDGLAAGDYIVNFNEPDTFDFTVSNVGTDDTIDSDADQATGRTGVISLGVGEVDDTQDAGLVSETPDAGDDTAKVCADETVSVNVLSNDIDDQPLTITAVNGTAISAGGSVDVNGITVSLVGGELLVDGTAKFADLLIRDQAVESFSYTVSDGLGGFDTADVDVTFCGAKNTDSTIAESFGTLRGDFAVGGFFIAEAYTALATETGDARFDGQFFEEAYCLERDQDVQFEQFFSGTIYVADDDTLPEGVLSPSTVANLDVINWIVNQDFGSQDNGDGNGRNYTDVEIQSAIWGLTNGDAKIENPGFVDGTYNGTNANAQEILDLALANGEGFEAEMGDLLTFVVDPDAVQDGVPEGEDHDQAFLIALPFDTFAEDCFCI